MKLKEEYCIDSTHHSLKITFDIHYVEREANRPLILFCHGFKGFKDWGYFNVMSEYFVNAGYNFVKLNFSHNGTTPDHLVDFVDLKAFGNNNFTKELNDIDDVINYLETDKVPTEISSYEKLFIVGHSKGGATSIVKLLDEDRFKAGATLASVVHIKERYAEKEIEQWKQLGVLYVHNGRTNQEMPLYYQLAEDVLNHEDQFNISERLKNNTKPLLMIHGAKDETVSVDELKSQIGKPHVSTHIIPTGDHVFNGEHPYSSTLLTPETKEACDAIIAFFDKCD